MCSRCVGLVVVAMVVYPGGPLLDPSVTGYSFVQNFVSDLAMTVTHGSQSNHLGAGLFVAGFALSALSLMACATAFVGLHSSSPRARHFARAAGFRAYIGEGIT